MTQALDIGEGAVHIPGAIGAKSKGQQMAKITARQRKALPTSKFADPAERKYPVDTKAHADNAMARLEQQKSSMSPGKYASIKRRIRAAQRRFGEDMSKKNSALGRGVFRFRLSHPDGSSTSVHHHLSTEPENANANAYYQDGKLYTILPIDKASALSVGEGDGEAKRVWVQVARTGAWAGHPQGAFQITESTLDTMIANFRGQGFGRIPWDFEHISAMPANSGNLPNTGKPAQGWAYDFRREGSRLFALTEWKPLARQYIESDQYQGVSPVIDWNGKDRVTGKPIGAMITSIALTQWPFISQMAQPTAASIDGASDAPNGIMTLTEIPEGQALSSAYGCHSALAMLPQLKSVLGLHELATAQTVADHLGMLRQHLDAVDGDGMGEHEGVDLGKYMAPMRTMVNAHAGMDWYAILDIIDELMDAYLDQHDMPDFEESHGPIPGTEASVAPTAASTQGIETVSVPATTAEATVATDTTAADKPPVVEQATVTAASAAPVDPSPELATLTLKLAELQATVSALSARNAELENGANMANESALSAEVDAAILTYKDTKGLTEELRPHLLSMLKATPEAFRATYPAVEPDKQHLLLNLTGGRVEADTAPVVEEPKPSEDERIVALGLYGLTKELMAQDGNKLSLGAATSKADLMLRTAQRALNK